MGLIAGASNDELPDHLIEGLVAHDQLETEIDAFVAHHSARKYHLT